MVALDTVLTASVHQRCGTHNIRLEEDARVFDGTVNMAFCGKVDHDVRMFFFKQFIYSFSVADIGLHKAEIQVIHDRRQRRQVACVGQLIEADNAVIRVFFQHVKNKIGTNKSGAAGNDDRHNYDHSFPLRSKAPKGMKHNASIAASRNLLEYA